MTSVISSLHFLIMREYIKKLKRCDNDTIPLILPLLYLKRILSLRVLMAERHLCHVCDVGMKSPVKWHCIP